MKKSEMIEILTKSIIDNIQLADVIDKQEISNILTDLVNANMLPPPHNIDYGVTDNILYAYYKHNPMEDYKNVDLEKLWEPENE